MYIMWTNLILFYIHIHSYTQYSTKFNAWFLLSDIVLWFFGIMEKETDRIVGISTEKIDTDPDIDELERFEEEAATSSIARLNLVKNTNF